MTRNQLTNSVIQDPENAEKLIKKQAENIVESNVVDIPKTTLNNVNRALKQLEIKLENINNARGQVENQIDQIKSWNHAREEGTVEAYDTFLSKHPKSFYMRLANNALNDIWNKVADKKSIEACEEFLKKHPNSSLTGRAEKEIRRLFKSITPPKPTYELNSNKSVNISWHSVLDAHSYRIYWSHNRNEPIKKWISENTKNNWIKQWPDEFPVYYRVVAVRGNLESNPSKSSKVNLLSSRGGKQCQICGKNSIGYCHMRNIYVCSSHNSFTSKSGTGWRCP